MNFCKKKKNRCVGLLEIKGTFLLMVIIRWVSIQASQLPSSKVSDKQTIVNFPKCKNAPEKPRTQKKLNVFHVEKNSITNYDGKLR
jgi:hypothetical protein